MPAPRDRPAARTVAETQAPRYYSSSEPGKTVLLTVVLRQSLSRVTLSHSLWGAVIFDYLCFCFTKPSGSGAFEGAFIAKPLKDKRAGELEDQSSACDRM